MTDFFAKLYEGVTDEDGDTLTAGKIVIWDGKTKGSTWHGSLSGGHRAAEAVSGAGHDAYFGVALQDPEAALAEARRRAMEKGRDLASVVLTSTRGYSSTAIAIPGLHADIDFAKADSKKQYAPGQDEVLEVLRELPRTPSLLVHSGGGLHAYWLLREPFVIENEGDRREIQSALKDWQKFLQGVLLSRGWDMDMTHDLARVLRVPGTVNTKYGTTVELLEVS